MDPLAQRKREVDSSELLFLIARCLDGGPCQEAAGVLREELSSKGLLAKRKNWLGGDVPLSYEQAVSAAPHVSTNHLEQICSSLQELLRSHGYLQLPCLSSLVGSGLTSYITGQSTHTGDRSDTALRCCSRLIELSAARCGQPVVNRCQLLYSRTITPSFSPSAFTGPNLYRDFKQHCAVLGHLAPVYCVMFDKTGHRVITGADDDLLKIWGSDRGQLLATLRGHAAEVTDMSLSPDNTMIASGSLDKTVRVWCAQSSATIAVLMGHTGHITSVQFSPCLDDNHRLLASTSKDGFVYFWTWNTESCTFNSTPIKYMEKNRVGDQTLCSAFSPGGKYFATGGTDKTVRVYNCIPGPPLLVAEILGHMDRIMTIQFCHCTDSMFATGSCDATSRVWRYREGAWQGNALVMDPQEIAKMMADWGKDKPQVTMIGWECTDTYLITAVSPDCHLRAYHASSGALMHTLKAHKGEIFVVETHPSDSRILLSAGHDGLIVLWDILSGTLIKSFKLQHEEDEGVSCIFDCRFSPDGSLCAAADGSGYLTLLGLDSSTPYQQPPEEQFFHTDYRPLMRDRNHFVVDEQSQRPPHLLPPPYLVDMDGHAHPARHQEALLQQMRPVKPVEHNSTETEEEDYDKFMRSRLMFESSQFRHARSAMAQREGAGGREREGEVRREEGREGEGEVGREEGREGEREGEMEREGGEKEGVGVGEGEGETEREEGREGGSEGEVEVGREKEKEVAHYDRAYTAVSFNGLTPDAGFTSWDRAGPSSRCLSNGDVENLSTAEGHVAKDGGQHLELVDYEGTELPQQLPLNGVGLQPTTNATNSTSGTAGTPPVHQMEANSGPSSPPPLPAEEPAIDVISQEEGRGQSVQNMLSSIVYSLGLSEAEEMQYLTQWYNRTIIPTLESSTLACMEARWRDIYDREQLTFEVENRKKVVIATPPPVPMTTEGRSLRSGRTLPDPSLTPDPVLVEGESEESGGGGSGDEGELWLDNESTASSDISDWTRGEGISFLSPVRRTRRLRKKQSRSESRSTLGDLEGEEEVGEEEEVEEEVGEGGRKSKRHRAAAQKGEQRKKRTRRPPVRSLVDFSMYQPPDWLKATSADSFPYFPQVGDIVVYFHQGHDLYIKAVKEERLFPWKPQKMPWQRYVLLPQEFCQVKNVHFVVGPPTMCSITLALLTRPACTVDGPSTSKTSSEKITFTFKYHDMDNVLEFLVLESVYKKSIQRVWFAGSRFRSMIDGMFWYGMVLGQEPFSPEFPSSYWQHYRVQWDDGATDQLSPWDMEPVGDGTEEGEEGEVMEDSEGVTQRETSGGWWEDGEEERILGGLERVSQLDEAAMFLEPVDLEQFPDYCARVPFPTDLATIRTRLQNRFYRRKIALLWEVVQIGRNAELYNEEGSLIVSHARVLVRTLCKFITSTTSDPLLYYQRESEGEREAEEVSVSVPDVEYVDNSGLLPPLPSPLHHLSTSPQSAEEEEEEEEEEEVEEKPSVPWHLRAEQLLDRLCANENSSPFLHPVDTVVYQDYGKVIREPMDLSKISKKLRNGHYIIPNDIIRDVRLIFRNAKTYNAKGTMVYKMTTELQSYFEGIILDFLKSCGGEIDDLPLHGTRQALGRLAHRLSSEDVPMATQARTTPLEPRPRRSRRRRNEVSKPESDSDSETEHSSVEALTPLTPASETSSIFTVQSAQGVMMEKRQNSPNQSHGMTLRERTAKRVLQESDSDEGEEEEGEEGAQGTRTHTRMWGTPHKRQRLSSESEDGEEGGGEEVTVATRTRRGRLVKPTHKYS